ncbi:antitoxin VbhA family protein [Belliella sp. R4-6]|uniref:Antitoxin VbhA family protein n=1 Tax=Belliella alkalica TaxID=1730871 RepID=A0ABS9VE70_9BACT|nr:antitoxin VbhA family protein [Belliella alkalica]MCH7414188.1 antitoxin VbhA family protein [Belliella alkalica]
MFATIEIDRNNLTIMGVKFSDLKTLESTANALGSNMFEGFKPTPKGVEIIRDYVSGKISLGELVKFAEERAYV